MIEAVKEMGQLFQGKPFIIETTTVLKEEGGIFTEAYSAVVIARENNEREEA